MILAPTSMTLKSTCGLTTSYGESMEPHIADQKTTLPSKHHIDNIVLSVREHMKLSFYEEDREMVHISTTSIDNQDIVFADYDSNPIALYTRIKNICKYHKQRTSSNGEKR